MLSDKDKGITLMIISHCDRIELKISNTNEEQFRSDEDLQEIICFNLFQIGELAKKYSDEFITEYNQLPWKYIKGLRDRIVHGYDSIDMEIIWNTANESIKELKNFCKSIL